MEWNDVAAAQWTDGQRLATLARSAARTLRTVEDALDQLHGRLWVCTPNLEHESRSRLAHLALTCGPMTLEFQQHLELVVHRLGNLYVAPIVRTSRTQARLVARACEELAEAAAIAPNGPAAALAALGDRVRAVGAALAPAAAELAQRVREVDAHLARIAQRSGATTPIGIPENIATIVTFKATLRLRVHPVFGVPDVVLPGLPMPGGHTIVPLPRRLLESAGAATS